MKKFLLGTAIAVTLVSATTVAFAESNLNAFDGIPSESVQNEELDTITGKAYYGMYQGQVVSASSLDKMNQLFGVGKVTSITTAEPSTWGKTSAGAVLAKTTAPSSSSKYDPAPTNVPVASYKPTPAVVKTPTPVVSTPVSKTYYGMYQGQVVSASSLDKMKQMFPTATSITTAEPSTWGAKSNTTTSVNTAAAINQSKVSTAQAWLSKTGQLNSNLSDIQKIQMPLL
jgi:hypothetical protein